MTDDARPNWLERAIEAISPSLALRRAGARHALRSYEVVKASKQRKISKEDRSANAVVGEAATKLRGQGRWWDENSDLGSGVLNTLVDNTVGAGIVTNPAARGTDGELAETLNNKLRTLWSRWGENPDHCDVTGQNAWPDMQRVAARSMFRDGDAFGQMVVGTVNGLPTDREVPLSIELLESEVVPVNLNEPDNKIIQGIRVNDWQRPVAYFAVRTVPGTSRMPYSLTSADSALKEINAADMFHLKMANRIGQYRGVGVFAVIGKRLIDVTEIEEAERIASRVAASMSAYIKKGSPEYSYNAPTPGPLGSAPSKRFLRLNPGAIFDDLQPGEDIGTINSSRPNNELIPFRGSQIRAVSAGARCNYSTISRDYSGTYSSQRQSLVEAYQGYRPLTKLIIRNGVQPVYARFVDVCIASGAITAADLRGVDMATVRTAEHFGPAMPAIDEQRQANANIALVAAGLKTREQYWSENNLIAGEQMAVLKREADALKAAGLDHLLPNPERAIEVLSTLARIGDPVLDDDELLDESLPTDSATVN